MIFKELQDDLFNRSLWEEGSGYVQCISADLRMGRGIAEQFNDHFDMKRRCEEYFGDYFSRSQNLIQYDSGEEIRDADVLHVPGIPVYNLVTKRDYWSKPTLQSMRHALMLLRRKAVYEDGIKRLLMPRIGCGLDRLRWKDVKALIFEIFKCLDVEIIVCRLREVV